MNVYDFDKTIYDGDCTLDFYLFSIRKNPILIKYLPTQIYGFLGYIFGIYKKVEFKEKFYTFLNGIENIDESIEIFWKQKKCKIKKWYLANKNKSDLIISASPKFLLEPICKELKVENLIASKVNKNTGIYDGENCYGEEKVIQFKKEFVDININNFFSDSLSDEPLSKLAEKSYIVIGEKLIEWNKYRPSTIKRVKAIFLTKQFLNFLIIGCINAVNGIIFSYIYSIFLAVNISFIIGYITAMSISYILNSVFVFKECASWIKYMKFCISYIPNFIVQNICVLLLYNLLEWNKILVFILAAIIGVPITFILMKFYAFNCNKI